MFQNTLINSWNFIDLDPKTIWHGNEHVQNITIDNLKQLDNGDKVRNSDLILTCFPGWTFVFGMSPFSSFNSFFIRFML